MVKNLPANAGDAGLIPGSGRSPREGNGNPLHYSCLENPIDREVWWAALHGVTKSWTLLSKQACTHTPVGGKKGIMSEKKKKKRLKHLISRIQKDIYSYLQSGIQQTMCQKIFF